MGLASKETTKILRIHMAANRVPAYPTWSMPPPRMWRALKKREANLMVTRGPSSSSTLKDRLSYPFWWKASRITWLLGFKSTVSATMSTTISLGPGCRQGPARYSLAHRLLLKFTTTAASSTIKATWVQTSVTWTRKVPASTHLSPITLAKTGLKDRWWKAWMDYCSWTP